MTDQHCVIIGASHAAASMAATLRQEGWEGSITMVGEEAHPPYHRPPLSKAALIGDKDAASLAIRPRDFYDAQGIVLRLGVRAESIDRQAQRVALSDGSSLAYTRLALMTGALPRRISLPGSDLSGVHYLRDMRDVDAIRAGLKPGSSAVIVGGGYIGLETAASLRSAGMQVTVLEAMSRVLQRVTAPEVSAFFTRVHEEEGVTVVTDTTVSAFHGEGTLTGVTCSDGREFAADLAIVGVGVVPDTSLAEAAGLEINDGIVVDEFARTSDTHIVAAGDCTRHYNPVYDRWLRLESVQNANEQARTAAKTVAGNPVAYHALPWFWSDQYDIKLQIAGLSAGYDEVVVRGDIAQGRSFSLFYLSGGRLVAADAINRPRDFMAAKRAVLDGSRPAPAALADESLELKAVFEG
ncbi:NAD(P)/FAD-dependent oxidoreductase [Chromatocurvus halotolerans]|uniref:3-phenylpropionate/trans-cinnamate dioxygenase ferredoxin reductase subunit n=1 Tax=Chromatocurvus halotolerans TaxID=1132028 RepID=A0A4R2KS08_9GAMM|nr:FAD-dependent oxidoreductase [Chromatocurvus halotolerans]TCO77091.1 3-phenylpropionate/trans-cinnamate dioxygenase ferredoxin reductase subunit [Chromatocurvus halotolerans]